MANDGNETEESTIADILNQGVNKVLDTTEELLDRGADELYKGVVATENLVERADVGLTKMRLQAEEEEHIWYQMCTTGALMIIDSAEGLLNSTPSELKSKNSLGYVGGLLGGVVRILLGFPAIVIEETVRYAVKKIAEKE